MFATIISSCSYLYLSFFRVLFFLLNLDICVSSHERPKDRVWTYKNRSVILLNFRCFNFLLLLLQMRASEENRRRNGHVLIWDQPELSLDDKKNKSKNFKSHCL